MTYATHRERSVRTEAGGRIGDVEMGGQMAGLGSSMGSGSMGFGSLGFGSMGFYFWIIILIAVAVLVWLLGRSSRASGSPERSRTGTPREILRRRFAQGEIDEEEYRRRSRALNE
jgi:putative membrane protein